MKTTTIKQGAMTPLEVVDTMYSLVSRGLTKYHNKHLCDIGPTSNGVMPIVLKDE